MRSARTVSPLQSIANARPSTSIWLFKPRSREQLLRPEIERAALQFFAL